jgi:hypothetical protein
MKNKDQVDRREAIKGLEAGLALISAPSESQNSKFA